MIKYYVNQKTQTIHMVGIFPAPKGDGFVQCGRFATKDLVPCTRNLVRVIPFKFCQSCINLTGEQK